MNLLVWLWDVLVVERRTTRLPQAINDAYERGRQDGYNEAMTDAVQMAKAQRKYA